jgi:hypothetical protein
MLTKLSYYMDVSGLTYDIVTLGIFAAVFLVVWRTAMRAHDKRVRMCPLCNADGGACELCRSRGTVSTTEYDKWYRRRPTR